MWKVTEHKKSYQSQELKVCSLVQEMARYTFATTAPEFESAFKARINEIPRTNSFSPDLMYRISQRNPKSVELWKMTASGDFKYKIFTLLFEG